ncbi:MAG TPA: hypothetical protein VJ913_12295 [Actinomycetota bacterium]|nr:hypothetical protein [Actinomycetota bacterium]
MTSRKLWALLALMFVLVACGRLSDDGGSTGGDGTGGTGSTGIEHPTGADEVVLRVEYTGGFVPVDYTLRSIPSWTLYGDGRIVMQAPQIEIYPPPALPGLTATPIAEDGVQAILEAARDAGLMDGDASYGNDCIADAATTVFTTNANGSTSVVSAYALDVGEPAGTCGGEADADERAALAEFQMLLGDLSSWLPEGSVGQEQPLDPTELRVYSQPYRGQPDPPQEEVAWPLGEPLGSFGDPVEDHGAPVRCGVVNGEDLSTVLPVAGAANEITPWTSDGVYQLIFRPLLPDESGCQSSF